MFKSRSSPWKTILLGFCLGLILTMMVIFGSVIAGFFVSSMLILVVFAIAAIAVAILIPKHRMLVGSMIAGGVIAALLALVALPSDGLSPSSAQQEMTTVQLEKWIGLDLPASATNLRSHSEGFLDWQVFVRFEMPKSDVKEFLRGNNLEPESNTTTYFSNDDVKKDWWKPEVNKSQVFKPVLKDGAVMQPQTKTGFFLSIQISDLEVDQVTVYISAFNS